MEFSVRECIVQWLRAVNVAETLKAALCTDDVDGNFLSNATVIHNVTAALFPEYFLNREPALTNEEELTQFLIHPFSLVYEAQGLQIFIRSVVNKACTSSDSCRGESLELLWGWIVALWFANACKNNDETTIFPEEMARGKRLRTLMGKSIEVLASLMSSENTLENNAESNVLIRTQNLGDPKGADCGPPHIVDVGPDDDRSAQGLSSDISYFRVLPLPAAENKKFGKDVDGLLRELSKENREFYLDIAELQKNLSLAKERNVQLEAELKQQMERIDNLAHHVGDKSDVEADMASELFSLKQQLAAEKTISSRLREKAAWLQVQLFRQNSAARQENYSSEALDTPEDASMPRYRFQTRATSFSTAPSLQKDIELEIKQLQADRNRHFAALQAAEVSRDCALQERDGLKNQVNQLRDQLLKLASLEADRRYAHSELMAQRAANATQFDIIHRLNEEICQLKRELETLRTTSPQPELLPPESLGHAIQTSLHQKVERLIKERDTMEEELRMLRQLNAAEAAAERTALQEHVKISTLRLEEAEALLATERAEKDRLHTELERVQRELEERRSASDQELEQYKQKAALYQNKADAIAAELHATQTTYNEWSETRNNMLVHLNDTRTRLQNVEAENRGLEEEITSLKQQLLEAREASSQFRQEIEQALAPQVNMLKRDLAKAEKEAAVLSRELELKESVLKEKDEHIARLTSNLEKTQSRVADIDSKRSTYEVSLQEYASRASHAEAQLRKEQYRIQKLEKEVTSWKTAIKKAEQELEFSRAAYAKLRKTYDETESERVLKTDECRRAESELLFLKTEFERLAKTTTLTSMATAETSRERPLRETLAEIAKQIVAGKQELEHLNRSFEERLRSLPRSTGNHTEFEVVDIVEHFEREKAKAGNELRAMTLRLTDAEAAYQALLREHQALSISHSTLLRDFIGMEKGEKAFQLKKSSTTAVELDSALPAEPPTSSVKPSSHVLFDGVDQRHPEKLRYDIRLSQLSTGSSTVATERVAQHATLGQASTSQVASSEKTMPTVERTTSLSEKTTSLSEKTTSPSEKTTSPSEKTTSPAERTTSPAKRTTSSAERMTSPAEKTTSPAGKTTLYFTGAAEKPTTTASTALAEQFDCSVLLGNTIAKSDESSIFAQSPLEQPTIPLSSHVSQVATSSVAPTKRLSAGPLSDFATGLPSSVTPVHSLRTSTPTTHQVIGPPSMHNIGRLTALRAKAPKTASTSTRAKHLKKADAFSNFF